MNARWIVGLLALAALLVAAPARAAAPPPHIAIRLAYDHGPGAEGCPDERGFRYVLMAQFGYDPTEPPLIFGFEPPPLLRVVLSRQGQQLRAEASLTKTSGELLWGDQYQERVTCADLARRIALVIRIGIGVDAPFAPPPLPTSPPPPVPVVASAPPPPPPAPPSTRPRVRVGLGTGIPFGVEPAAAVGFSLQLGLRWPVLSISLEGWADLPVTSENLGIRTSLLAGTLLPCGHLFKYGVACALLTVGSRTASLLVEPSSHGSATYAGAGARLGIEVPFAGERLVARISGDLVGVIQPGIVRVGIAKAERWTTPVVSGGPALGLLLNF